MSPPSQRIHTFGSAMRERHGERVHKIALDAGFTCPNRDGSKGIGGCTFCNNKSFAPGTLDPAPLAAQFDRARGHEVWLELGLQSSFDATLVRVNRGHGFAEYQTATRAARARGIPVCCHLLVGPPGGDASP